MLDNQQETSGLESKIDAELDKRKVLVVTSSDEIRDSVRKEMEQSGFDCDFAEDADKALNLINSSKSSGKYYSLAVVDINLPFISGVDLLEAIHKSYYHVSSILMSGQQPLEEFKQKLGSISGLTIISGVNDYFDRLKETVSSLKNRLSYPEKKILFVDSDGEFIDSLTNEIDIKYPIDFNLTSTAAEAINGIRNEKYDIAVVNLILPKDESDKDGSCLVKLMKEANPSMPVITTSKFPFLKSSNANAHVQKGYQNDVQNIVNLIGELLYGEKKEKSPSHEFEEYKSILDSLAELINKIPEQKEAPEEFEKALKEIETITGLESIADRIKIEEEHFSGGMGGRDKGYVTKRTAVETLLRRSMICRGAAKADGINDPKILLGVEKKMWEIYNLEEQEGQPIPFTEALEKAVNASISKHDVPYIIVLIGPSCSGKTTMAKALQKKMKELGHSTEFVGNIKEIEPRKREKSGKDDYITEDKAKELQDEGRLGMYRHLGRRYFSKDDLIKKYLGYGENIILVRNIAGLRTAGDFLYNYIKDNPNSGVKLISIKMDAKQDKLKERLDVRLEKSAASPDETKLRKRELASSINEYNLQQILWDKDISTHHEPPPIPLNQSVSITLDEMISYISEVRQKNPILQHEYPHYINRKVEQLTDGAFDKGSLIKKQTPPIIPVNKEHLKYVEIIKAEENKGAGVLTLYLNSFYDPQEGGDSQKEAVKRKEFMEFLKEKFKEAPKKANPTYGANPSSTYSMSRVIYADGNNRMATRLDDIALFSLIRENEPRPYKPTSGEIHSIAFVCLEHKVNVQNNGLYLAKNNKPIIITELS